MNTYLLPICYPELLPEIITVVAQNYAQAQDKLMSKIARQIPWEDYPDDWEQFKKEALEQDCLIGDFYDKDQF